MILEPKIVRWRRCARHDSSRDGAKGSICEYEISFVSIKDPQIVSEEKDRRSRCRNTVANQSTAEADDNSYLDMGCMQNMDIRWASPQISMIGSFR